MTWEQAGILLFAFAILCEQAHIVSPIVLAWSHRGLRQIALSRPIETILLPVVAMIAALMAPFWIIFFVYQTWNCYHFGMQHYGVSRIFGWKVPWWLCVVLTTVIMGLYIPTYQGPLRVGLPLLHDVWIKWFLLIAIDFNHWIVDIGLSSRVSKLWWVFLPVVLGLGCVGFLWKAPQPDHITTWFVPLIIQARWGAGIIHFLYSRWVWKLSDPRVRAAIGRDLLPQVPTEAKLGRSKPLAHGA